MNPFRNPRVDRIRELYSRWKARRETREVRLLLSASGLFDSDYYLTANVDVRQALINPVMHYLHYGRHEKRAPSERFDPAYYLENNPDVEQAQMDPAEHYLRFGYAEGRRPKRLIACSNGALKETGQEAVNPVREATAGETPAVDARPQTNTDGPANISDYEMILRSGLFDPEYYRAAYLDVALCGVDPLRHYVDYGRAELRKPSLDFDPNVYRASSPDIASPEVDLLLHYLSIGQAEGRTCRKPGCGSRELAHAVSLIRSLHLFDEGLYVSQFPAVCAAGVDPLLHYLVGGFAPFVDPGPAFSTSDYLTAHPEVRALRVNPLLHSLKCEFDGAGNGCGPANTCPIDVPVDWERAVGSTYFQRFLFASDSTVVASGSILQAISNLVCCQPRITIDRLEPVVSIIIPVFGQTHFALSCLHSLSTHRSRYPVEIILADDASPSGSQTSSLNAIPWIRYARRETNVGFLDNCNQAAKLARGRFLVFLNSDTRVVEGWLDELIDSFKIYPRAGLIGSALINSDGTLQEAGGIVWRDGSAWNYGRNRDFNHPKYRFARQVDYVSAASVAIRADVWQRLEGFDPAYRPAYCEDTDLAFRIREAGYEVWLQPLSQVIHYEGKTHGVDLSTGVKHYQLANTQRLASRWQDILSEHRPNGNRPDQEANRMAHSRILVLDALTPTPDRDSGSFITIRMMKALQSLGYQITFVPQESYRHDGDYTQTLQRLGIECLYQPYFSNIRDVLDFRDDFDVVLAYRFYVLNPVFEELRRRLPSARIIFHNVDLHYLREDREANLFGDRKKKIAAAITRATELELIAKVDCTMVHTQVEASIIRKHLPVQNIVEFPYVAEVHRSKVEFEDRHDIMFLGGMNHCPNVDAVLYFTQYVWPILADRLPSCARFLIVGSSAPAKVRRLAGPRVVVTGYVEDLQPYFESARVMVAPLRYGAGIKGKVIQSLCYGTPSVISSVAAEGIGLVSGCETLIADDDLSFIGKVLAAYSDPDLWHGLQSSGYEFVQQNFSWKRCLDLTSKALDVADAVWLARHERASQVRLKAILAESHPNELREAANVPVPAWEEEAGRFYAPLTDSKELHEALTLDRFNGLRLSDSQAFKSANGR